MGQVGRIRKLKAVAKSKLEAAVAKVAESANEPAVINIQDADLTDAERGQLTIAAMQADLASARSNMANQARALLIANAQIRLLREKIAKLEPAEKKTA